MSTWPTDPPAASSSVVGQYSAASRRNRADFRIVALGNPVAGERNDERFEAWMEQTEVSLLDLSPLWKDRSNLIAREYHFNQTGSRRAAVAIAEWLQDGVLSGERGREVVECEVRPRGVAAPRVGVEPYDRP